MGYYIFARTIGDAWYRILRAVWQNGKMRTKDEWGSDSKEILNLLVTITNPTEEPRVPKGFPWSEERLEEYAAKEFLSADKGDFSYTYGNRLLSYEGINQIEKVIERINRSKKTRRAVAITWMPKLDLFAEEVPCLLLWDWKVHGDRLYQTTVIRSNDMYGAWPANAFGLMKQMEYVAQRTGTVPGEMTTLSISAHIYARDFENVKRILGVRE